MRKRVHFSDQGIIIFLLIIALFLFVEALMLYRYIRESSSIEFTIRFADPTEELKVLLGNEGYRLMPGDSLDIKVHRKEKVIVEQAASGRYTVRIGDQRIEVSIPYVEVSVK
jgi:protein involved in polysaccharide export with SLBB domain